jgi:peptidoglycan/LPS O-acetylase OafA/YrhL
LSWYDFYVTPTYRLPQFLIGMLFGYALHISRKNSKTSIKTLVISYIGWFIALGLLKNIFYDRKLWGYFEGKRFAYEAIFRSLWSFSICWIAFACHQHKTGSLIKWFLSLRMWQPLSKMGLSIYIFHGIYLDWTDVQIAEKAKFSMWFTFMLYMGDLLVAIVLGTILYLFVEAPTGRILALMWKKKKLETFSDFNHIRKESFQLVKSENQSQKSEEETRQLLPNLV